MFGVTVLAVGRLGEKYLADGCAEYLKRLGAYCKVQVIEIPEFRLPNRPSEADIERGLRQEGEAILARLPRGYTAAALCIEGRQLTSPVLARTLDCWMLESSGAAFIIGGSWGLSSEVKRRSQLRLSLSEMTFPHQLARLMLLEQLYRAFNISRGGKYHK